MVFATVASGKAKKYEQIKIARDNKNCIQFKLYIKDIPLFSIVMLYFGKRLIFVFIFCTLFTLSIFLLLKFTFHINVFIAKICAL